jgi:hypothetical protein
LLAESVSGCTASLNKNLAVSITDQRQDEPRGALYPYAGESPTSFRINAEESGDPEFEKESRLSLVLLEWGSRGMIAYVDGVPAG